MKHKCFPVEQADLPKRIWPDIVVFTWIFLVGVSVLLTSVYLAWVGAWFTLALIISMIFLGECKAVGERCVTSRQDTHWRKLLFWTCIPLKEERFVNGSILDMNIHIKLAAPNSMYMYNTLSTSLPGTGRGIIKAGRTT